jgi:hypothetical protein
MPPLWSWSPASRGAGSAQYRAWLTAWENPGLNTAHGGVDVKVDVEGDPPNERLRLRLEVSALRFDGLDEQVDQGHQRSRRRISPRCKAPS